MPDLSLQKKAQRMRIYIGESDRWRGKPLHLVLLDILKGKGIAGATVVRGVAGFGAHFHIHATFNDVLSQDLPLVIDVVDSPEKISQALDVVSPMIREGLITLEDVQVVKYTHRFLNPLPADRLVSEVMTREVVSLTPEMPVYRAWQMMIENKIKAMPVIDQASRCVGILTDEDLIERAGIQERLSIAVRMDSEIIKKEISALEKLPMIVGDVMTKPVVTVKETDPLAVAAALLIKAELKRLPVVNAEGQLLGMLSRLDVLRQVVNAPRPKPSTPLSVGAVKTLRDIMSPDVPIINQDDDLTDIIEKFSQSDWQRLVVVDSENKAIGLISDSDVVARIQPSRQRGILDALRQRGKPSQGKETAYDLMSPRPLTALPDLPVVDAIQKMLVESRKWLVIVNEAGCPLGLVDRQILLEAVGGVT
jgi:CBS domain-containing protein